jgi:hypothetical protein
MVPTAWLPTLLMSWWLFMVPVDTGAAALATIIAVVMAVTTSRVRTRFIVSPPSYSFLHRPRSRRLLPPARRVGLNHPLLSPLIFRGALRSGNSRSKGASFFAGVPKRTQRVENRVLQG